GPQVCRKFLGLPSFTAMTRSQQRLLSELATSDNELASGLGQCLETLPPIISALPRASPVFVKYTSTPSSTTKAFALPRPSPRTSIVHLVSIADQSMLTMPLFEAIRPREVIHAKLVVALILSSARRDSTMGIQDE
ncbi:hypothetical protein EV363DRAFT_1173779, partial [Boletus edulis]